MLWPDLQTIVETIPNILFLINKKRRSAAMPITEQLFYQLTKAATGGVPLKKLLIKILQFS